MNSSKLELYEGFSNIWHCFGFWLSSWQPCRQKSLDRNTEISSNFTQNENILAFLSNCWINWCCHCYWHSQSNLVLKVVKFTRDRFLKTMVKIWAAEAVTSQLMMGRNVFNYKNPWFWYNRFCGSVWLCNQNNLNTKKHYKHNGLKIEGGSSWVKKTTGYDLENYFWCRKR